MWPSFHGNTFVPLAWFRLVVWSVGGTEGITKGKDNSVWSDLHDLGPQVVAAEYANLAWGLFG